MKTIKQIKLELSKMDYNMLPLALKELQLDERAGVRTLVKQFIRKIDNYEKIKKDYADRLYYEKTYIKKGLKLIAGIDEVGRGPLAGPVVSACVILPQDIEILGIDDSKKLTENKREELYTKIKSNAFDIGIGIVDVDTIDRINILQATYLSMQQAINNLSIKPDIILVDAVTIPNINIAQKPIIKGDSKSISIGAASIIAKVTRDHMMMDLDELYPKYKFYKNKGYGTKEHIDSIKQYGLSPIHRKTFTNNIA